MLLATVTIAAAALLFTLLTIAANLGEAAVPRLGGHFFSAIRTLLGIGLLIGAWYLWWAPPPVTSLQCEITDTFLDFDELDGSGQPLRATLRWHSPDDGEWYRNKKPVGIPFDFSREELMEQYREGGRIECYYFHGHPGTIYTGRYTQGLTQSRIIALCMSFYGLFFAFMGARRWLRMVRDKKPLPWRRNISSAILYMLATWALLGYLLSGEGGHELVGWGLVILALTGIMYFVGREAASQNRGLQRIKKQLRDSKPWPVALAATHLADYDEHEYEGMLGTWRGCPVRVAVTAHDAVLQVELPDWPRRMAIAARPDSASANAPVSASVSASGGRANSQVGGQSGVMTGAMTGDPDFDAALRVDAEPLLWRPRLSRPIRRMLLTCLGDLHGVIEPEHKILTFRVDARQFSRLDYYVNSGVELSQAISAQRSDADRRQWLFEQIPAEPNVAVRLSHYQWLHDQGWNIAQLSRAAAADADPRIREWAAGHLPPTDGIFR